MQVVTKIVIYSVFLIIGGFTALLSSKIVRMLSENIKLRFHDINDTVSERQYIVREIKRHSRTVMIKMGLLDRMNFHFIERSNIKRYLPWINIYIVVIISIIIFIAFVTLLYRVFYFIPSALVISSVICLIPFFILDIVGRYYSVKIRKSLSEHISVLNRWCEVKEDIFYAFEKSLQSDIAEPLKTFITHMLIQVRSGIDAEEALEILCMKVNNTQFGDFISGIKQNVKNKGDIKKLLQNLEDQFYKIEEEYNRRKISTYRDRLLTFAVMIAVMLLAVAFLNINPDVRYYYLNTFKGKLLMTLFCMLYAAGMYTAFGTGSFNH